MNNPNDNFLNNNHGSNGDPSNRQPSDQASEPLSTEPIIEVEPGVNLDDNSPKSFKTSWSIGTKFGDDSETTPQDLLFRPKVVVGHQSKNLKYLVLLVWVVTILIFAVTLAVILWAGRG